MLDPMELPSDWESREWRHVIISTYGAWLHGDARGFRTRHHREHVEGDYRNPPPAGRYACREQQSRRALKHTAIALAPRWRGIVGQALVDRWLDLGGWVLCAAMSSQHAHVLVKVPRGKAREWSGLTKKHAWFVARSRGWRSKLWGVRGREIKVRNRQHHANVYRYILDHEAEGAWVWRRESGGSDNG